MDIDLTTLSAADLDALFAEKFAALDTLRKASDPSPADMEAAVALATECKAIKAQSAKVATTAADFAALADLSFDVETAEPVEEPVEEPVAEEVAEPVAEVVDPQAAPVAAAVESVRSQIAAASQRPAVPASTPTGATIVSTGEGTGFAIGSKMDSISQIAAAAVSKMRGFQTPNGDGTTTDLKMHPIASVAPQFSADLVIDRTTSEDKMMEILYHAADETRLPGNSLTAALGWCSPSETMYDLKSDESLEGIASVPEVQVKRGGMRYTVGPQFADFYAEAGFSYTEAQIIAGVTKPCYTVDCPSFQDVRLDAIGVCIKVPFLVNAAYPELTTRFTSGTLIAHEHMVNAGVINKMVALSGTARVFTGLGGTVDDGLEAFELVVAQRRQTYRLPLNRTMEALLPHWVRGAWRADLGRRQGQMGPVSDAELMAYLRQSGIAPQFVYDWQDISLTAEVYPATYQALVYPAGTFVKGVSDVVNVSAVYDAASLAENTFTGLFVEKGLLVAKVQYDADLLTLPIVNYGRRGAQDITNLVVTP